MGRTHGKDRQHGHRGENPGAGCRARRTATRTLRPLRLTGLQPAPACDQVAQAPLTAPRRRDPLHLQALPQDDPAVSPRVDSARQTVALRQVSVMLVLARPLVRRHPRAAGPPRLPALQGDRLGERPDQRPTGNRHRLRADPGTLCRSRRDRMAALRACCCAAGPARSAWRAARRLLRLRQRDAARGRTAVPAPGRGGDSAAGPGDHRSSEVAGGRPRLIP